MLENTSLRRKLWLPSFVAGAALLLLMLLTLWLAKKADRQLVDLERAYYPSVSALRDLQVGLERVESDLLAAVLMRDTATVRDKAKIHDPFLKKIRLLHDNPILNTADLEDTAALFQDYYAARSSVSLDMISAGAGNKQLEKRAKSVQERHAFLVERLHQQAADAEARMLDVVHELRRLESRLGSAHWIVLFACVAMLALVSHGLASDITSLIQRLQSSAARVANGELHEELPVFSEEEQTREDELGRLIRSFSAMRFNLRILVAGANTAASSVIGGANALGKFQTEISRAGVQQDRTVTKIDTSLVGIAESIDTIGRTMDNVSSVACENSGSTEELEASAAEAAASLESQQEAVDQVAMSAGALGISIQKIAKNAQTLNRSAAVTSAAVEELGRATDDVNSRAEDTARVASDFNERSLIGQKKAVAAGESAAKVQEVSRQLVELMNTLSTRLQVVGQINNVIQDIVDETTLLSLNARIVSAQAGNQGKSFAVVAEAIKELAARAGKSTDEIRNALSSIQEDAGLAAAAVEANVEAVESSASLSTELASELDRIGEGATRCLENMSEISAACIQQSQGLNEVRNAVKQVGGIADQVDSGTSEQASAAALVHGAVEEMRSFIEQIRRAAAHQRRETLNIATGATDLAQQVEEVARAIDETRSSGESIRQGLQTFSMIREHSREAAASVEEEVSDLVEKTREMTAQLEGFTL